MSADTHYIDLTPEKCISIPDRHILIKKYKSDDSYYQGRPINPIEGVLVDLIIGYRAELAALRDDSLQLIGANRLLSEIGSALDCAPDATILNSISALRDADIRTMEHCDECGDLLMLDADAPEDTEPYCPSCELEKARATLGSTLTQMIRIGNALNWNPPIDQAYGDAINAIRAALQPEGEQQP